jgi:hypothetical protein
MPLNEIEEWSKKHTKNTYFQSFLISVAQQNQ